MRLASLFFVFCLLAVLGCDPAPQNSGSAPQSGQPKKLRIAVIPKGTSYEFWKSVHFGAERAAQEAGNVEILWKGPLRENDREGQISVVEDFITRHVDGIALAPLDAQALVKYVAEAHKSKIPTVIFDSALADPSIIVSYVATDNYKGGVLAAQRLGTVLGKKGNVIMLRYNPGSESTEQREQGFLDTIKKEFPEMKVISSSEYGGTSVETSFEKSQQLLVKFRKEVQGIFTVNESSGSGMHRALQQEGLAGKVKFVTFDPSPALIQAMTDKTVDGIVLQDPVNMGYVAVKTMLQHLKGDKLDKRIPTGEYIATPENKDSEQMKKLLNPNQFGEK